jgi:hypothetical protein
MNCRLFANLQNFTPTEHTLLNRYLDPCLCVLGRLSYLPKNITEDFILGSRVKSEMLHQIPKYLLNHEE